MVQYCANRRCTTARRGNQGKLFRLDIELGNLSGGDEHLTEYVWLCTSCAQVMHPRVQVAGDKVTLLLAKNDVTNNDVPKKDAIPAIPPPMANSGASLKWVH